MPTLPVSILHDGSKFARRNLRMRGGAGATMPEAGAAAGPDRTQPKPPAARTRPADVIARASEILAGKLDFMPNPEFSKVGAERRIFDLAPPVPKPSVAWYRPVMEADGSAGPRRNEGILLTAAQERVIFMQFNYARYRVERMHRRLKGAAPTLEQAREVVRWHSTATRIREQIAETNLALVLAMAKRVRLGEGEFPDLIGEGNMALMRAVDKFDCARGFKFSTYACRAILKAFSRHGMKVAKHRQRFPVEFDPALERGEGVAAVRAQSERRDADELRRIVEANEAELTDVERAVVMHRFALEAGEPGRAPTLAQVGRLIGLTKERVRQIQNTALEKLRMAFEGAGHGSLAGGAPVAVN